MVVSTSGAIITTPRTAATAITVGPLGSIITLRVGVGVRLLLLIRVFSPVDPISHFEVNQHVLDRALLVESTQEHLLLHNLRQSSKKVTLEDIVIRDSHGSWQDGCHFVDFFHSIPYFCGGHFQGLLDARFQQFEHVVTGIVSTDTLGDHLAGAGLEVVGGLEGVGVVVVSDDLVPDLDQILIEAVGHLGERYRPGPMEVISGSHNCR